LQPTTNQAGSLTNRLDLSPTTSPLNFRLKEKLAPYR